MFKNQILIYLSATKIFIENKLSIRSLLIIQADSKIMKNYYGISMSIKDWNIKPKIKEKDYE